MRRAIGLAALACAALAACMGPRSLTRDRGSASRAFWERQRVSREVATPVSGLDSQEAAIVAQSYRRGLAPKGTKLDAKPQVLILEEDERGRMAQPKALAPSVPKERP